MTGASLEKLLIDRKLLSLVALKQASRVAADRKTGLLSALRSLELVSGADLASLAAEYYGLALVTPAEWRGPVEVGDALSTRYLREHLMVPVASDAARLVLAVADPGDSSAIEAVQLAVGRPIELRVAPAEDIEAAIERLRATDGLSSLEITSDAPLDDVQHLKDLALGAPVVQFVNNLLLDALHARATDIHIEPFRDRLNIRLRIDGMLGNGRAVPANLARAVVSRLKILSGLDIAERRMPQDGRVRLPLDSRTLDLRVATMPTIHGEAVALRLLESNHRALDLGRLGFPAREERLLRKHLAAPHGLILVTGPTGSGKTTTLASALTILNEPHRKIFTVEDPIEYQIDGINQTQAKPEIDLTFATVLRHFLRHDPDVLMVGEMRDTETARIAVQAALTGHLVLSTLHTNSAAGAITRLLDMQVDGYLLASCLTCVVGQRLVRVLCVNCREQVADAALHAHDRAHRTELHDGSGQWHHRGCERCHGTGFLGRTSIVEVFEVDDEVRALMHPGVATSTIASLVARKGMTTMATDGLRKGRTGVTTLDEVQRVTLDA